VLELALVLLLASLISFSVALVITKKSESIRIDSSIGSLSEAARELTNSLFGWLALVLFVQATSLRLLSGLFLLLWTLS
jgi:hypothetical protein